MDSILDKYIPKAAIPSVLELLKENNVYLKIVKERVTRHGDYRKLPNGQHKITINSSLNPYRFLVTLIHEIAHLIAFTKYGREIKPHGKEWKLTFKNLMVPLLRPEVFPLKLLPVLALHFKNPKASSDTDVKLSLALKHYDAPNDKNYIFEIPEGGKFKLYNGRVFLRGPQRVKRFECIEISSGRIYLFSPNAEVKLL